MPEGFLLGVLVALGLLAGGMLVGIVAAWQLKSARAHNDSHELQPVLSSLVQFTNSFSQDVSEYRSLIEAAAARAKTLSLIPSSDAQSSPEGDPSGVLLAQIMQANEHLRLRLEEAESSLHCKSEELQSYMTEARTDSLTGLPNRRALDDELSRRMAAYRRQGTPLGMLLVDVDRFKRVNDTYGHHVGDQVLKVVAESLRQAVRDCDLLARYGGEEFAVLVAGGTQEEFMNAAERVRQFVEQHPAQCEGVQLHVTISCGVAEASGGEEIASLLRRADEALYASKTGGRNCAHWHDGRRSIRITAAGSNASAAGEADASGSSEKFRDVCAELRRKLLELS
jgi:diguanylate cyclase